MSKIEWTTTTWNPTTGCDKVSQGCKNCYAEVMHKRLRAMGQKKYQHPFLGHVQTHPEALQKNFGSKPKMIFVNSMSDLFHEDVPVRFIVHVFATMARWPQHTFQILTKRPGRMEELMDGMQAPVQQIVAANVKKGHWPDVTVDGEYVHWPLPNVWLGTSAEDQKTADKRIPHLLQTPAAIRFVSCEPLLGPVDLDKIDQYKNFWIPQPLMTDCPHIDWIIAGGESGPNARPMHPDWVRSLRDQCVAAGVPFFFKQWGAWLPFEETAQQPLWRACSSMEEFDAHGMNFIDPYTSLPGKWQGHQWMDGMEAIHVGNSDDIATMYLRCGKKKAGNRLDGETWQQFPEPKATTP